MSRFRWVITSGRCVGGEARLDTADALTDWLASLKEPVFSKPNHGTYGRLARLIERFDPAMKRLELGDGSFLPLEAFVREVADPRFAGNLFQRIVRNAAPLEEAVGKTLSTVRLIVVVTPQGPMPHLAFWKVANGKNMTDNFSRGRTGNLLASIDLDSGTITNAIARLGAKGSIDAHPTTGARLLGLQLPSWKRTLDTVCRAAIHFPGLQLQNWDVALTDEGPVLLEVNTEANLEIPQAVSRRGFLDGPAGAFLRRQLAP